MFEDVGRKTRSVQMCDDEWRVKDGADGRTGYDKVLGFEGKSEGWPNLEAKERSRCEVLLMIIINIYWIKVLINIKHARVLI